VEVGSPLVSKQVTQLLLNRIVPREGDCLRLDSLGRRDHVLTVPKDVLDLHACSQVVGHCELHAIHVFRTSQQLRQVKQVNEAFMPR